MESDQLVVAMTPTRFIRTKFDMTQGELAQLLGVSQAHVSRMEQGVNELMPNHQRAIRDEAKARKIKWDDSWFFAPPEQAA